MQIVTHLRTYLRRLKGDYDHICVWRKLIARKGRSPSKWPDRAQTPRRLDHASVKSDVKRTMPNGMLSLPSA